jgi:hypothetical protein
MSYNPFPSQGFLPASFPHTQNQTGHGALPHGLCLLKTQKNHGVFFVYPWLVLVNGCRSYADPWADFPKKIGIAQKAPSQNLQSNSTTSLQ